ncbi:hypothetical protein EZV62_011911 [Acer yangbiense]|uniref:Gnk2-homologous domain-containing protein n=1 Tax=Acer yangbiense TaxID=1000413 RepID=A0A5C7I6U8_9ROSI|nr:hypothetical protein EZV62_011911 [Acer yangbiense]
MDGGVCMASGRASSTAGEGLPAVTKTQPLLAVVTTVGAGDMVGGCEEFFVIFVCLLSLSSSLFTFTSAADPPTSFYHYCSDKNFTRNSTYQSNLNLLLSSLPHYAKSGYGFYRTTKGLDPNIVYGLFQCRGDVTTTACQDCVASASMELTQRCPTQNGALVWYDECYLRFSNVSINSTLSLSIRNPNVMIYNSNNVTVEPNRFQKLVLSLLKEATTQAVNDPKKFPTRKGNFTTIQTLYGLVQCAEDLWNTDCSNCLEEAISRLPTRAIGGRILLPSCNCRYELYPFYNENLTTSPPVAPTPVLQSPPSPVTRPKGKSKISSSVIIAIVTPITVSAVLFLAGYCFLTRRARKKYYSAQEEFVDGKNDESSIAKVIEMLRGIPEIERGSEFFMKAVRLFLKKENIETFVALKDHDLQIMFLEQA